MTLPEAKELSIKMWTFLVQNPQCRNKEETPYWDQLKRLKHNCPLCAVVECAACPIQLRGCALYKHWLEGDAQVSAWAAREILGRVKEWMV